MTQNSTDLTKDASSKEANGTCHECLQNLYLMVDGEASKEQEDYFNRHMDECIPCFNSFSLEKSVKEFLKNRIEQKPVPQSLVENIKSKIALIV